MSLHVTCLVIVFRKTLFYNIIDKFPQGFCRTHIIHILLLKKHRQCGGAFLCERGNTWKILKVKKYIALNVQENLGCGMEKRELM